MRSKRHFEGSTLKKLDHKAKVPANVFTYTFGVIAALVMGVGMCLSMKVIGDGSTLMVTLGIIIGVIDLALAGVNYPLYKKLLEHGKKKYAFEIMELAKQISDESNEKRTSSAIKKIALSLQRNSLLDSFGFFCFLPSYSTKQRKWLDSTPSLYHVRLSFYDYCGRYHYVNKKGKIFAKRPFKIDFCKEIGIDQTFSFP